MDISDGIVLIIKAIALIAAVFGAVIAAGFALSIVGLLP